MIMDERELKNWEETRKKGAVKYVIVTSLLAYLACFCIYVFGNAYVNRNKLNEYIVYNLHNIPFILLTSVISIFFMMIATIFVWKMSESRYKKTLEENNKNINNA